MRNTVLFLGIVFGISAALPAPGLVVGDAAPPLQIGEWMRPSPVNLLDFSGTSPKPYFLIEFWATWCQPCRRIMPDINDLQRRYAEAGFVVIAVSTERPEVVRRFVEASGPGMNYAVAVDTANRDTYNAYMRAVNAEGIPYGFLVDRDGVLVWHGVPSRQQIEPLIQRMAGTEFTLRSEQLAQRAERLIPRYFAAFRRGDADEAATLGERIIEWGRAWPDMLREFAQRILTESDIEKRDAETALRAATVAAEAAPDDFRALETLALAQFKAGRPAEAAETQRQAIAACPEAILRRRMQESLDKFLATSTETAPDP